MGEDFYPPGPSSVRSDLTKPTAAYKRHAYLAVTGVLLFLVWYFALAAWFTWTAVRLFSTLPHAHRGGWFLVGAGGAASAFLAILMIKAVFFVRRSELERDIEVTPETHPRLFAFLHRLADDARAPRPHRVFLSARVNAGVYYDLSLANLISPSKKNLEIGLGLVNALTLAELKAVLAHEFGHFAQGMMALSRWVYIAHAIALHLVTRRDAIDRALQRLSNADPRGAWIGWGLRAIVWSIRSLIASAFGWVMLAKRALSREMELQADLVAVSLTGSDALVHALYRTLAADDALDRAASWADEERGDGKAIADLFAIQSEIMVRMRAVLGEGSYGVVPPLPAEPATHRLFKAQFAQAPRMWSTHPANRVREQNAKAEYVAAPLDDRSAWVLFEDPDRVRVEMTTWVYARAAKNAKPGKPLETLPIDESVARLRKKFDRQFFDAAYRGVYLGRSCVRSAESVSELYGTPPAHANVEAELGALYPETISVELERMRELTREHALLRGLQRGILETPGKMVRYRDREYRRRELPQLIDGVNRELESARGVLSDHDKRVRATHLAAARKLSPLWEHYLKSLAGMLHYAEHRLADLADAVAVLQNSIAIAFVDGRVSSLEHTDLVAKSRVVYGALVAVHREAPSVHLGALAATMGADVWMKKLGILQLDAPTAFNIGSWLNVVGSWAGGACGALDKLAMATLDELLRAEREVAERVKSGEPIVRPPESPRVPLGYPTLVTGRERLRQTKLGWWERFLISDGIGLRAARFLCAGAVVAPIVLAGYWEGDATVYVINGLNRPVVVTINDREVTVSPRGHHEVDVAPSKRVLVRARTAEGAVIESFEAAAPDQFAHYVYDVASAAPLVEYTPKTKELELLRVQRWTSTTTSQVGNIDGALDDSSPWALLVGPAKLDVNDMLTKAGEDAAVLAAAHARWDPPGTVNLDIWVAAAEKAPDFDAILAERLAAMPDDVMIRRSEQDHGPRKDVCARHAKRALEVPDSPDWQFLAARCIEDPTARNAAFDALAVRWPDAPWIMYGHAGALADRDRFDEADKLLARAIKLLPEVRAWVAMLQARIALASGRPIPNALIDQEPLIATLRDVDDPGPAVEGRGAETAAHDLHRGKLSAALAAAFHTDHKAAVMVLVACSDGATPAQIAGGALAADKLSSDVAIYAYALALRTGRDPAPYRKLAEDPDSQQMFAFIDQVHQAASGALWGIVPPVDLKARAMAYAATVVLLGDAAPEAMRAYAKRALFDFERPYLR